MQKIYPESGTTLPEGRFFVDMDPDMVPVVKCSRCEKDICDIDNGDDLNTLVRLADAHLVTCKGEPK